MSDIAIHGCIRGTRWWSWPRRLESGLDFFQIAYTMHVFNYSFGKGKKTQRIAGAFPLALELVREDVSEYDALKHTAFAVVICIASLKRQALK